MYYKCTTSPKPVVHVYYKPKTYVISVLQCNTNKATLVPQGGHMYYKPRM